MITKKYVFSNKEVIHRHEVRMAYDSPEGRAELVRLLTDLGTFREIHPQEIELRNYGIRKMEELGLLDIETIVDMVDWFFERPLLARATAEEMGMNFNGDPLGEAEGDIDG